MLTLRRLRAAHPRLNSHLPKSTRPDISCAKPRQWNRPLAKGVLPAYDEALNVIKNDSSRLKQEAKELRATLAESEGCHIDEHTLNALRDRLTIIEVQSEINLPMVRWMCNNGMGAL
jgi:large subunit ribosomal protein L35